MIHRASSSPCSRARTVADSPSSSSQNPRAAQEDKPRTSRSWCVSPQLLSLPPTLLLEQKLIEDMLDVDSQANEILRIREKMFDLCASSLSLSLSPAPPRALARKKTLRLTLDDRRRRPLQVPGRGASSCARALRYVLLSPSLPPPPSRATLSSFGLTLTPLLDHLSRRSQPACSTATTT